VRRAGLLALLAILAAGCGSEAKGKATVWVTRNRGSVVVVNASVPAGLTAAQGLERVAKVSTRYGGRYVRSVNGVSEHGRSSWFYYVNGYLADRSAAEYRLRAGDVEWWDYRSWADPAQDPVVVGAFPEPFLHGYDGQRRPAVVLSTDRTLGRRLARLLHGRLVSRAPAGANVLEVLPGARPQFSARARLEPGAPVRFELNSSFARSLLADPSLARHRYEVP
jgi:Domain of unknown function (DUF4430)